MSTRPNRPIVIAFVVGVVLLGAVLVVAVTRSGDDVVGGTSTGASSPLTTAPATTGPTTSGGSAGAGGAAGAGGSEPATAAAGAPGEVSPLTTVLPSDPTGPYTTPNMPVEVAASNTKNLANGAVVRVRARPKGQSEMYGVEARLCAGDARVERDPDFRPTQGGMCAARPLSPGTDNLVGKAADPPYQEAELAFRVGVGSDTFTAQDGRQVTITCGPANPCQLVLKLQYPNGFGFQSIPVTFA